MELSEAKQAPLGPPPPTRTHSPWASAVTPQPRRIQAPAPAASPTPVRFPAPSSAPAQVANTRGVIETLEGGMAHKREEKEQLTALATDLGERIAAQRARREQLQRLAMQASGPVCGERARVFQCVPLPLPATPPPTPAPTPPPTFFPLRQPRTLSRPLRDCCVAPQAATHGDTIKGLEGDLDRGAKTPAEREQLRAMRGWDRARVRVRVQLWVACQGCEPLR
jgi:hypothetical protein